MAANKTQPTDVSPTTFLETIEDSRRRADAFALLELIERITGEVPRMWGPSIIGFGRYRYRYLSGREGNWMLIGFSPRKANLVLYVMPGFEEFKGLLHRLGPVKTGKSCLYIKRLSDLDMGALEELVSASVDFMRNKYGLSEQKGASG